MLGTILQYLNNWFVRGIYAGDYEIKDGSIVLPFLVDGQYFRILGSLFNDGLHKYPDDGLVSERFNGVQLHPRHQRAGHGRRLAGCVRGPAGPLAQAAGIRCRAARVPARAGPAPA